MKHQWILRKAAALLTALLLVVSVMPAACAASPDWDQLQIILSWTDESGTAQSAYAVPVTQTEAGEGVFWAMLPPEALMSGVTFEASHPLHAYEISPAAGTVLEGLSDAGQAIDGISYYPVSAYDPETGMAETFLLYVSTVTSQPELITPEPEIITPEPEIITPEPEIITPEPEIITPEPEIITPEPEIITPEPEIITPEPEIITPEPEIITPEPEIITPEPEIITPEPEVITPEPEIITPEPEIITPEPADLSQSNNEPTDEPTDAPVMPVGEMINRYGVTTTNVNYRKTPSTNGQKYSQLPSNTHVYLIITELNEKGEEWTLVEAEGHTGYLKSEFLRVLTEEDSEAYNLAQSTQAPVYDIGDIHPTEAPTPEPEATPEPAPTDTPTPEPTDTPEPTAAPVIEDGVLINRYATTNKGKVNVRQQPSVNSGRVTTLEKNGEHVYLLWSDTNDQGEHWTRVRVNGQDGYIKNDFLNLMTQEDSDAYSATQANPEKVYTMEELFPSPEPTAEPTATPEPTAEPTATPEPTEVVTATPVPTATPAPEMPVGEMINRYGMTKSKVFFRKEASTNAGKIAELSKNAQVYLIYTQENEVGEMWTYAMVNGQTGYIMTKYLNLLTEEDSSVIDNAQATRAPAFALQDIFPTEEPTPVVTLEATEEPPVAETETPEPTDTPEPTEKPTEAPTDTPEPTEKPTEAPTDTPEPTEAPTQVPTDTPTPEPTATPTEVVTATPTQAPVVTPTSVPYQRIGYAITIGDGVPVRQWPTSNSSIIDILGANKIVYVTGQAYIDGETVPWSAAEFDGKWGYVRADMLRMISAEEMNAFSDLIRNTVTPMPETTVVPYVYNPDELSCYGYVTTDSVNFREGAGANTKKIRQMKRYALFLVYGSTEVNGETWYQVSYDGQMGYLNGKYFKQMTVSEADEFFASTKYAEGIANNSQTGSEGNAQNPQTTANPTGVVSAEDQRVSEWVNPATGSTVSYEPFDPFATPAPLPENELEKNEFVKSLIDQIQAGQLKPEDAQTELEKFYKDAKDPEGSVKAAMAYIQEKTGLQTEEPSESPEPQLTEEPNNEYPQEKSSGGGAGWIIALLVLAAAGGGGYYWYLQKQRKREAAQRIARKKAAESRGPQGKKPVTGNGTPSRPVSAQNAAKVRTGTYTDKPGSARPKATPNDSASAPAARKPYSAGAENPYGRYTSSDTEEEASYTASFKPNGGNYRKPEVKDSGEDETKE